MEKLISNFPDNITEALQIALKSSFVKPKNEIRNVVFCGMGGSGFGGLLVSKWFSKELKVPFSIIQGYILPNFVNENTLLIGSSYSGDTEETLECIYQGKKQGAEIVAICSGGKLSDFCDKNQYSKVIVPGGNPPRTALAYSMVQIMNILAQFNLITPKSLNLVKNARDLIILEKERIQNKARSLASFFKDKTVAIYSEDKYEAVAIRTRQQFNENSKVLCWHHVIPEMNHNELVGWGGGNDTFGALFIETGDLYPNNQKRLELTKNIIQKQTKNIFSIIPLGINQIEKSIYIIHLVDWASFYLAEIKKEDVMEIKVIDFLKSELAKS